MTTRRSPTMRRRRLGMELRRLRESAGLTIERVADDLGCSDSKVSRLETGQVAATPRDVGRMLDLYGITGEQRESLLQSVREAREKGWWQAYSDTLVVPLVGMEAAAVSIRTYEAVVVPGLLQTTAYAQAVIGAMRPDLPPEQIERRVEFRKARQQFLFGRENPPALTAMIDEAVLHRPIGGADAMRQQVRHLAEIGRRAEVTLRILPFAAREYAAMSSSFTIFGFSDPIAPDVVYLELITDDLYLEDADEVQRYTRTFDQLSTVALEPDESLARLASMARKRRLYG